MGTILRGRVECGLSRGQPKDEPTMARIHRLEPEDVAEEGAVRFRIFSVNNDVSARDHPHLLHSASPTKQKHRSEDRPLQLLRLATYDGAKNKSRFLASLGMTNFLTGST